MRAVGAGDVVGRYELGEIVGEGGMATVFRARDRELRREVAIKVLFPHLARRAEVVQRFQREARAAANLEHPNILRIYDVGGGGAAGDGADPPYIVMELVKGRALVGELELRGPLFAEVCACIGALLADALAAAHAAGVVHRDVKPHNVLVADDGRVLLADFGVARLETEDSLVTRTGAVLGTPAYMSPEQAVGDLATARSDLYSLGATLYQLATGALPYAGPQAKVLAQIAEGALVPAVKRRAEVGPELSAAIDRLMAADAERRPASASEVAAELRAIAAAHGFGDPADEVAAYVAAPGAFVAEKTPRVVDALVRDGKAAVSERRLPRAMAIADRAAALAPAREDVAALVRAVTDGGRTRKIERAIGIALVGAAVIAGGAYGVVRLESRSGGGGGAPVDGAIAVAVADAPVDARSIAIVQPALDATIDASIAVDAAVAADAPRVHIARVAIDAAVAAPPPLDAMIAAPDAPLPPALGSIAIVNDVWCDVSIDRAAPVRKNAGAPLAIPIAAGHHVVTCSQPGTGRAWTREVDVAPGTAATAAGALLGDVAVTAAIAATLDGAPLGPGAHAVVKAGYHQLEAGGVRKHVDLRAACTVRDQPELDCYP